MQIVCNGSHSAGKLLLVYNQFTLFIATIGPAVIQDDISVSQVLKAILGDELRMVKQQMLRNIAAEGIPVILSWELVISQPILDISQM